MANLITGRAGSVFVVILLGVVACANIGVTPPIDREPERSRVYELPYDSVWSRAVDWFADHNVLIDKIEKESGLFTARLTIQFGQEYLDCGEIRVSGVLGRGEIERSGALNMTVRRVSDEKSKVSVNLFGEWNLQDNDAWDGRPVTAQGRCVSTGELERSVLAFIGK